MKTLRSIGLSALLGLCALSVLAAAALAEVDYKKLGYENELYTYEGKPYTGTAIKKDKQGRVRGKYTYANGLLNGTVEEWYTNGVRSVETPFVQNQRHGTNSYWNLDGSLLKRQTWREGKLIDSTDKHDLEQP